MESIHHTRIATKGVHSILRPTGEVLVPSLIRFDVGQAAPLHGCLSLAHHALAVEDEKGDDAILLELVKVSGKVRFDARQAAEGGEEGLMEGWVVKE
jgi:hypothetical protein